MVRDGRTLDHKTLEEIRRMAVERVQEGEAPSAVIASYGFCRTTIYQWLRKVKYGGRGDPLRSRKGTGRPGKLPARQKRQVFRWVNGKDPRQYGFDFGLWTRQIVAALIAERFGVELSLASVGKLLAELGLTPQKPLQRAYERDPAAIEAWKRTTYPQLAARAKREGAEIYFWDESGFRADAVQGKTWGMKGRTPIVEVPGKRQSISAASAVNAKGAFWFVTYQGGMTAELFIALLKHLMRRRRKPLFLVLDILPAHKAKMVRDYVESTNSRLELHFLPGYAPELNPDELVWNDVKRTGTAKSPLASGELLQDRTESDLQAVQGNPALVRPLFKAPCDAPAAIVGITWTDRAIDRVDRHENTPSERRIVTRLRCSVRAYLNVTNPPVRHPAPSARCSAR
jgi:transposase